MTVCEIVRQAAAYGVAFSLAGERLHARELAGASVPAYFRGVVDANTRELVRYVRFRDEAAKILGAAMRELADAYIPDCPLDGPQWAKADELLTTAFWTLDVGKLHYAVDSYVEFARAAFAAAREGTK